MIPKEIIQKVRKIEITTSRLVSDVFSGQYHSVFKGQGMEFDEVREYQVGDDIRTIDRNVTARTGRPHVKKFVEEREMTVMLLVDASRSCHFGSQHQLKSQLAAELAAVLAFSAIRNNDKVGLIIFTDGIEKFIPPRKGFKHVLRVIREVLYFKPQGRRTDMTQALDYLNKVTTRRTVSFIISDFFDPTQMHHNGSSQDDRFKKALTIANRRHDIIAVTLNDPREIELVDCGLLQMEDAETGNSIVVDSSDPKVRKQYNEDARDRIEARQHLFNSARVDHVSISTDVPYAQELVRFFKKRRKRLFR